jgi:hypothetical protein
MGLWFGSGTRPQAATPVRCRPEAATRWIDRQGPSTVLFQLPRPTTPPSGDDHVDVSGCYTTKSDTVEDGLTERASEGNPRGGGGKEANPMLSCNPGHVGRNG